MRDGGDSDRSDKRRHRSPAEKARRSPLLWGVVIFGVVAFALIYLFDRGSAASRGSSLGLPQASSIHALPLAPLSRAPFFMTRGWRPHLD